MTRLCVLKYHILFSHTAGEKVMRVQDYDPNGTDMQRQLAVHKISAAITGNGIHNAGLFNATGYVPSDDPEKPAAPREMRHLVKVVDINDNPVSIASELKLIAQLGAEAAVGTLVESIEHKSDVLGEYANPTSDFGLRDLQNKAAKWRAAIAHLDSCLRLSCHYYETKGTEE